MAVYVDDMYAPFGRMKMCHMLADTEEELHAMADRIGVARKWFQRPPKAWGPHYDIAMSMRAKTVAAGAVEINWISQEFIDLADRVTDAWCERNGMAEYAERRRKLRELKEEKAAESRREVVS